MKLNRLIAVLSLSFAVIFGTGANCTKQQDTNVVNAVFTDLQAACMAVDLATVVIPATPSDQNVTDVVNQVVKDCDIARQLLPSVQNAVNQFIQNVGMKRGKHAMVNGKDVGTHEVPSWSN